MYFDVHAFAQNYTPRRIQEKIALDGVLNEEAWKSADAMSGFMQIDPVPGGDASSDTRVQIVYDDNFVYVAAEMLDDSPDALISTALERDSDVESDDGITIIFDSYNDNLNGLAFATNLYATRLDYEIFKNGQGTNYSYNTFWNVKCSKTDKGWVAEFQIPLTSLRFKEAQNVSMGFKAIRYIKRKNESSVYPKHNPEISDAYLRVDLATDIIFEGLDSQTPFYIIPYAVANLNQENHLNADSTSYVTSTTVMNQKGFSENDALDKVLSNIGLDVKIGLSKNYTLDLTANTDFSQVEVDNRVINTTRYNVFFPEKRVFFQESQDYFNFSMGDTRVFNSRNIGLYEGEQVPIIGGARLTGQSNGFQVGVMSMQTKGVDGLALNSENHSVVRLKKNLFNNGSYIGGIVTNKTDFSASGQTIGFDYLHRINNKWYAQSAIASSMNDFRVAELSTSTLAGQLQLAKFVNQGFSHLFELNYIGESFYPEMGFIRYQSLAWLTANNGYTWLLPKHKWLANVRIENVATASYNPSQHFYEFFNLNLTPVVQLKNGAALKVAPVEYYRDNFNFSWFMNDDILVPAGDYHMFYSTLYASSPWTKRYLFELNGKYGDFYGGTIGQIRVDYKHNINKHIRIQTSYEHNTITFPDAFSISGSEALYRANLASLSLTVNISSKMNIKGLVQYDDLSNSLGTNFRFRYNPKEGTDLYIVFNQNMNTVTSPLLPTLPNRPVLNQQLLSFKFTHTINARRKR